MLATVQKIPHGLAPLPTPVKVSRKKPARQTSAEPPPLASLTKPELLLLVESLMTDMLLLEKTRQQQAQWLEKNQTKRSTETVAAHQATLTSANKQMLEQKAKFAAVVPLLVAKGFPFEEIIHVGLMAMVELLIAKESETEQHQGGKSSHG